MNNITKRLGGKAYLEKKAKRSIRWIRTSFEANNNRGSSAFLSQFKGWSFPYPETTGYLIPTLLDYADYFNSAKTISLIEEQLRYLLSIQNDDGSFPRFSHEDSEALVFDTSQVLLGLNSLAKDSRFTSKDLDESRKKAFNWLVSRIDKFGRFDANNFVDDYNPSYYTRILWPLYQYKADGISEDDSKKLERSLDYFMGLQNENLSFKDWSFEPDNSALTHTIAYTLRGLYEISVIEKNEALEEMVKATLLKLVSEIKDNNWQVAATYDRDWSGNFSFICSSGNAQLFILFNKVFDKDQFDIKLYESLLGPLIKTQRKTKGAKAYGAVPSSIPIWGKYQRFKYTNWTQKFYLDALLLLLRNSK